MDEYKPNSHKYKDEQKTGRTDDKKKIEKVVRGTVKTKKKSEISKLASVFVAEDMRSVGTYLLTDVVVPGIINTIEDLVTKGIRMLLRGEGSSSRGSTASKISYRNYYDKRDERGRYDEPRRAGYNHDDIVLETRGEAEEVLTRMDEIIEEYGEVSVADLYDLIGKSCAYTDNKYGWKNIRNAEPVRVRDGYLLKLPKALPLNER